MIAKQALSTVRSNDPARGDRQETVSVTKVLLDILIVLLAAKAAAEVAERLRVPAVVGEIVAGIIIGPSVLQLVKGDEVLRGLGELGVILLLLEGGLEIDIDELGA